MLIGLAAKNSILIVEFAEQLRGQGRSIVDAAVEAARIRLRPILMTSFAFILGVLPLAYATGAGAGARNSVGTAVAGGMLASTFLSILFIPVLYVIIRTIAPGKVRLHGATGATGATCDGCNRCGSCLRLRSSRSSSRCSPSRCTRKRSSRPPMEAVTLEQAVERAIKNNPTVAQAAQGILRAEGLLQQARAATMPFVTASFSALVNSTERRFDDVVTSPQTQATLSAQFGMPVLAASRWAATAQARDQVEIANLSTADVRTDIAVSTAQAYLAIIALKREVEVTQRALETSLAHLDYARRRLEAGAGTRLNELRAGQEVVHQRGAARDGAAGRSPRAGGARRAHRRRTVRSTRPATRSSTSRPITDEAGWMALRPDVRLFAAEERAADRVWRDSSKDWFPTAIATFDPQALVPASIFSSARSWRFVVTFLAADVRRRTAARA